MKLTAKTIPDFLRAPDKTCVGVLIYGPDGGQVRERALQIRRYILGESPDPFALSELTEDILKQDPVRLSDELSAISLLGGRRLVLVSGAGEKTGKAVQAALEAPLGDSYLIVCAEELTPRSGLRSLFEGHARLAALPCYKDEAMDIAGIIRGRLDAHSVRYSRDVAEYLQRHLGNDRYVTYSELDKILLYLGEEKQLTLEIAEQLVGHNRDVGLDLVIGAAADRNPAQLELQLSQAFKEGVQPIALLRAAQKHFQRLYYLKGLVESGSSAESAVAAIKPPVFFKQVPVLTRQVGQWSRAQIAQALAMLGETELTCKGASANPQASTGYALLKLAASKPRR